MMMAESHPNELFVKIRGFSWTDTKEDIINFFKDENIKPGRIVIPMNKGKNIGEAIIEFSSKTDANNAVKRHKQYLHNRYMEVYQSTFSEYVAKENYRGDGESESIDKYNQNRLPDKGYSSGRGGRSSDSPSHSSYTRAAPYYAHSPPIAHAYSPPLPHEYSPPPVDPYSKPYYPNESYNPYQSNQSIPPHSNSPPLRESVRTALPYNSKLPSHSFIVRIRGVPFTASKQTISHFFSPLVVDDKNITIVLTREGRPSGGAFVVFNSEAEVRQALAKSKDKMSGRSIELFRSSISELQNANTQNDNCLAKNITLRNGETAIIKLRGLPYTAQERDIVNFFKKAGVVDITEKHVHVARGTDGRPSGIAFVEFRSTDDVARGMICDREKIANRYIELFHSNFAEMKSQCGPIDTIGIDYTAPPPPPRAARGPPRGYYNYPPNYYSNYSAPPPPVAPQGGYYYQQPPPQQPRPYYPLQTARPYDPYAAPPPSQY